MVNKFGAPTGADVTNQRTKLRNYEITNSWIRGFVVKFVGSYTEHGARGFTLPELLVSISIFVIITTAVVVNFRASEESGQLRLGAQAVASTLHSLQNMAQTGRLTALCDNTARTVCTGNPALCGAAVACSPGIPAGGYGIQIAQDGGAITLFADGNKNYLLDPGETLADMILNLPRNVVIADETSPYDLLSRTLTITFEPPEPEAWINAIEVEAEKEPEARIVLRHEKKNETRTILLRRISGRIEIQ